MISPLLRRVAADSNVILSAVIGKAALAVFTHSGIEIMTTEFNCCEVREYLPLLSKKYKINEQALFLQFEMLPIKVYAVAEYKNFMPEAAKLIKDPDDAHLLALAMMKGASVWSNDNHFKLKTFHRYTTAELLKLLKDQ